MIISRMLLESAYTSKARRLDIETMKNVLTIDDMHTDLSAPDPGERIRQ